MNDLKITNIHWGKYRPDLLYACLYNGDQLMISATLYYITESIKKQRDNLALTQWGMLNDEEKNGH
jgi:hypothetical protein